MRQIQKNNNAIKISIKKASIEYIELKARGIKIESRWITYLHLHLIIIY